MNRTILWAVLVIGAALLVAPFAISLPGKSAAGERMMDNFQPIMQPDQVRTTVRYYDDVFVPLGKVAPMMSADNVAKFQSYATAFQGMKGPQADAMRRDFGTLLGAMASNTGVFAQVPGGLTHYEPLVRTMDANVENFDQVSSLPDFRLFTWFFVVPGALLLLLSGYGLFGGRAVAAYRAHHAHPAV